MIFLGQAASAIGLVVAAPLTVWIERRVKAWTQLRRGPSIAQPYRDLRRLWNKTPLVPDVASPFFRAAPALAFSIVFAAALTLPLWAAGDSLGGSASLLVLGLLLTLHRVVLAIQAYDTGTSFGGLGASRELFLGGLGEPAYFLVAAGIFLSTGTASIPDTPLDWAQPSTWLLIGALAILWIAESARIPFDNPATHLELTMVHEAMLLESSGWLLALHEWASALKQSVVGLLLILLLVPLPGSGVTRVFLLVVGIVLLSGILAFAESGMAKVRLFRASHLLVMASLLAFFGGAITYLEGGLF